MKTRAIAAAALFLLVELAIFWAVRASHPPRVPESSPRHDAGNPR